MTTKIDLRELAVDRLEESAAVVEGPPRAVISRYLVPGVVLAGFAALTVWAARDSFLPTTPVSVTPVVVARAEVQESGTPLFQAAGWVEPRPTPIILPALTEGIVQELLVVEGQDVERGDPVAKLIAIDAELELRQSRHALALQQAELQRAQAVETAARQRFNTPVHLETEWAKAEASLLMMEAELAKQPFLIEAATAKAEYARRNYEIKQTAGTGVAKRSIQQAKSESIAAQSVLEELQSRTLQLERQVRASKKRRDALAKQLELLIDESRDVAESAAEVAIAKARVEQATVTLEQAELRLERMTIRAPVGGRVLALLASPGTHISAMRAGARSSGSGVIHLYQPHMLQVRADVRLEDVPHVQPGQLVQIETASVEGLLIGRVLTPTSRANIQKNTLEVKVAVDSPPDTIRPEMLVTATFLAPQRPPVRESEGTPQRMLVPRQLVESSGEGDFLWIAAADSTARRQPIQLGRAGTEQRVEVTDGIAPTDKLITTGRESLSPGDRIHITGESLE